MQQINPYLSKSPQEIIITFNGKAMPETFKMLGIFDGSKVTPDYLDEIEEMHLFGIGAFERAKVFLTAPCFDHYWQEMVEFLDELELVFDKHGAAYFRIEN